MWNEEQYIQRAVDAARAVCDELVAGRPDPRLRDHRRRRRLDRRDTGSSPTRSPRDDPHVRVVHHPRNRKLGGSIKSGFAAATGDVVLYTDADLPFEMEELVRALRVLQTYEVDVVSAYRLDRTGEGPRRAVYSFLYNWLVQLMFRTRLRDINFAFKLCRRRVLDHVTLKSESSFIDAELVIRAQRSGFQILQIGVDYFPRTRGVSDALVAGRHQGDGPRAGAPAQGAAGRRPRRGRRAPAVSRLLVVTADDLGLTRGVNEAVRRAHRDGHRHRDVAAGRRAARSTTRRTLVRDLPDLELGAHLALVGEDPPLLSAREVPTLVDARRRLPAELPHASCGAA